MTGMNKASMGSGLMETNGVAQGMSGEAAR